MLKVIEELGDHSRRLILSELREGRKSVGELCELTGLKQANVSNHLARMKFHEVVTATKIGRQVFYSLSSASVESMVRSILQDDDLSPIEVDTDNWVKLYSQAAVDGDEVACEELLNLVLRAHFPLVDIYQDLLTPAMGTIGNWWKLGLVDVSQEHVASEITQRIMARASNITGPIPQNGRVALLGCPPNSLHMIGLRMISDYLRMNGWKTLFLGANVPIDSFLASVRSHRPHLVLLSVNSPEGVASSEAMISALADSRAQISQFKIGVGGLEVLTSPERFMAAGADFWALDLKEFARDILPGLVSDPV